MLLVGIGGVLGAIARYVLGKWITSKANSQIPVGTWLVNMSGSLLLGFLAVLHIEKVVDHEVWLMVGTGFLGAYTTFSTFGYETIQLIQKNNKKIALLYVIFSVILGIIFAWIGGLIGYVLI